MGDKQCKAITNKRNAKYDFIRVIMFLFVVALHTHKCPILDDNFLVKNILNIFLYQCNAVFFMISGILNLEKKFVSTGDWVRYYVKRFRSLVLPYIVLFGIMIFFEKNVYRGDMEVFEFIRYYLKIIIEGKEWAHLWFLYTLIGFIISTPPIAKMLTTMNDSEIKVLLFLIVLWNFVSIYLCADMGIKFGITGWLFHGWFWAYMAGYIINRLKLYKYECTVILLGVLGYIITVLGATYLDIFVNPVDLSVGYILFSVACYVFMIRKVKISEKQGEFYSFLGKHIFSAYIIHLHIKMWFTMRIVVSEEGVFEWLISIVITFISSIIVAIILDELVVDSIQRGIDYIYRIFVRKKEIV